MDNSLWLIEKMWIDDMENRIENALGYNIVGYVMTKEEADKEITFAGTITGDGWPIAKGAILNRCRAIEINKITVG